MGGSDSLGSLPVSTQSNCSALYRSAELDSAVSQSCTLPGEGKLANVGSIRRCAEYNSAIRQIENLRYAPAPVAR